jgi:WXG100 family type VII secretion target
MAGNQKTPGSDLPDATFKVDFAVMREAVGYLRAAAAQFDQALSDHAFAQAPLYRTWSGSARDHQYEKHGEWMYAAWTMASVIRKTGDALDQISQNYENQEQGFVKMWTPPGSKG